MSEETKQVPREIVAKTLTLGGGGFTWEMGFQVTSPDPAKSDAKLREAAEAFIIDNAAMDLSQKNVEHLVAFAKSLGIGESDEKV